jgi:hypothetical protein
MFLSCSSTQLPQRGLGDYAYTPTFVSPLRVCVASGVFLLHKKANYLVFNILGQGTADSRY